MTQTVELETNTKEDKLCRNKKKFNKPSLSFQAVLESDVPAGSSEFLPKRINIPLVSIQQ